jgi:hypothetical protein
VTQDEPPSTCHRLYGRRTSCRAMTYLYAFRCYADGVSRHQLRAWGVSACCWRPRTDQLIDRRDSLSLT